MALPSQTAGKLSGQPMFDILARAQEYERKGRSIIHLELGDPDFATPSTIVRAACASLYAGETHYTNSLGIRDLRKAIASTTSLSRHFTPDIEQVVVTPGANCAIYYAIRCLLDPGDDIILADPCFPTYLAVLNVCDVRPIRIPLIQDDDFRLNPERVRARITPKTRALIVNSPHNPCGSVTSRSDLDALFDIATDHDLFLLTDETYARFIYDNEYTYYSPAQRDRCLERTVLINSFSKAFAMTGWRLGAVIAPQVVAEKIGLYLQTTFSCVPPFIQRAGMEAIRGSTNITRSMIRQYAERRDLLVDGLSGLPEIACQRPSGAFYAFPSIRGTHLTDEMFAQRLLDTAGVAVVPGSYFGDAGAGHVRISFSTGKKNIVEGLRRMRRFLGRKEMQ